MKADRSNEPFFWSLFSSGGMLTALSLPALAFAIWIAAPLGWLAAPSYDGLVALLGRPLVRIGLFGLLFLAAFHWAHRFRFTLYDGLQLSHLFGLIATVCYGGATILTLVAGWLLWTFP